MHVEQYDPHLITDVHGIILWGLCKAQGKLYSVDPTTLTNGMTDVSGRWSAILEPDTASYLLPDLLLTLYVISSSIEIR